MNVAPNTATLIIWILLKINLSSIILPVVFLEIKEIDKYVKYQRNYMVLYAIYKLPIFLALCAFFSN